MGFDFEFGFVFGFGFVFARLVRVVVGDALGVVFLVLGLRSTAFGFAESAGRTPDCERVMAMSSVLSFAFTGQGPEAVFSSGTLPRPLLLDKQGTQLVLVGQNY